MDEMWRPVAMVLVAAVLAACGTTRPKTQSAARRPAQSAARPAVIAGGCGSTRLYRGGFPAWTAPAFSDSSNPPPPIPYGIAEHGNAIAVVFGFPLRAGHPTNPANKVLWIMRLPRGGAALHIVARPLHAPRPQVRLSRAADSSPGEIYPSYVDVPRPGCWRLTLKWAGHTDSIDLKYKL